MNVMLCLTFIIKDRASGCAALLFHRASVTSTSFIKRTLKT